MKQKLIYLSLFIFALMAHSCQEDEIETWHGKDYIQFAGTYDNFYSFVYAGSAVERDTVALRLSVAGMPSDTDRSYKISQVKSYTFVYEYDELGSIVDSAFIEVENQAIPDQHYVDLEGSEYENFIIPADSLGAYVNIVFLRDETLQDNDYKITLEVQENDNFAPGYVSRQKVTITISDQIIEPTLWNRYQVGTKTVQSVMGYYGKKKHQLLIDTSGQRWNDDFIQNELTEEYLVFYKSVAAQELDRINAEREEEGLFPLREDDDNPNSVVKFN